MHHRAGDACLDPALEGTATTFKGRDQSVCISPELAHALLHGCLALQKVELEQPLRSYDSCPGSIDIAHSETTHRVICSRGCAIWRCGVSLSRHPSPSWTAQVRALSQASSDQVFNEYGPWAEQRGNTKKDISNLRYPQVLRQKTEARPFRGWKKRQGLCGGWT